MRRFTRLALAALAAIGASGALVAAPAASWVNFADTTSDASVEGVRQYTLSSGDYTITVNGTPNADGSVTLGTSAAGTNNTGIVLTAGAPLGTKQVSVMLDIGDLPASTVELLAINLNATNAEVELKRVVANNTSTIQQQWNNSNGSWGNVSWTPTVRQILTLTYSGGDGTQGTATYLNGFPLIANKEGLKSTTSTISRIGIGENSDQSATGMKVYGIYLFTSKLTDAQVASETAAVITAVGRTAEVSRAANWSGLTWTPSAPTTSSDLAVLQVAEGEHTLTLDNGEPISLLGLFTQGTGSLTFNGSGSMTSSFTSISSDTDVSAITANLGAVTLASNRTLTTKRASDFSSITAGAGSTVKYTAPSGSIAKVDNATVELAAAAETSGITLPSAGGTYKVSSGTYTGMTLTLSATATNYTFAGGKLTFNGEFSFGKATATISGGTIRAPKMVTVQGGNDYRSTSVTQTGGDIILSGTTDGSSTQNAVVMFGHWPNASSTYTLSAGSIKAEQGGMRFGNDSSSTLNLSGTGLLKVKGIWGKGSTDCALNLSGGKLSLGSEGFKSIGRLTVTATGGELNAFASNTIAQAIALNGPTTFSADAGFEMTVQGTLSGSGALTIGTETATGTVVLGTQRPTIGGIADGATVKLTATDAELANCAITFSTTMGTAPAKERFTVVKPDGTTVLTLTAEPTITDGTLTVPLPHTGGVITATGNWSTAGVSEETVVYVRGGESAESAITVTLDANLSDYTQIVVIGHVKFVTTTTQATLPTAIVLERGSVLTATASFAGAYTIPSGATVVLDGTTAISSASVLTVNGALKTQGTVTLSGANTVPVGGTLTVETGTLTLTANGQGLAGTINIAADATLVNVTGDALAYNGSPVVNVRGTLDMGSTRWTVGNRNTLNVYAGATIKGVGDQHGALDFYNNGTHTLNVPNEGDASQPVTISAKLRLRQANVLLKFNIALANAKVNLTGIVRDVGSLEKAGSGSSHLVLSGEDKTYAGTTTVTTGYLDLVGGCTLTRSGVTVASGAAVTFQADDASTETTYAIPFALIGRMDKEGAHSVILSGTITGAGAVNVKNGGLTLDASAATAESPRTVANPITVGLDSGNAGTLTTKGYLTLSNESNKIAETGKLVVASDTTVLATASGGNGIKGNLTIASNATLKCGFGDAPRYSGSQTFDISGTLEITGQMRWTISSGATIKLHEGALLKGAGPASASSNLNCAFDFWEGGTITADGDATIEATLGNHNGGQTLTITQSAGTTTITGEVRSGLTLKAAGSGTVVYAPAAEVTATTSPLVVDTGATLQLLPKAAFTLNGTVTGAGKLVIGDGSAATAVKLATAGNSTNVTVSTKATLEVATEAGEENANKSFTDGKTVTNNGTLKLTSGYGYFKIGGTGKTVVPGSDFLFGIGGENGDEPFSNGLEVLASANFRIRPWNKAQTIVAKGTAAVNGSITKDGGNNTVTLQIAAGTTLAGSSTFSIPVTFANDTTAKMASNATFTFSSALTVPKNVTLPGTVTLAEGATLSGVGDLSGTVTLGNGVIIDATESTVSGHLQLTGAVTLGDTLKVKASKLTNVLDVPTSAGLDLVKVSLTGDSIVPAGTKLVTSSISSVTTLKLFVPPAMPKDDAKLPPAIAGNDAIMAAIQEKAEAWLDQAPISEITSVSAKNSAGGAASADGATLFTGLEVTVAVTPGTVKEDGTYKGTATVTYDFGVSDITVKSANLTGSAQLYVVVCAKVSNATGESANTADYATGIALKLLNEDAEVDAEVSGVVEPTADELAALGLTAAAGERWLAVPMATLFPVNQETGAATTGTMKLKVQATNTTP